MSDGIPIFKMSKTPGESRIPMLLTTRRTSSTTAPGSPQKGSAPGTPTSVRRPLTPSARIGVTALDSSSPGSPVVEHAADMPATARASRATPTTSRTVLSPRASPRSSPRIAPRESPSVRQGKVTKLARPGSSSKSTGAVAAAMAPSKPTRPTSFPKPVVREPQEQHEPLEPSDWNPSGPSGPSGIGAEHVGHRVQIAGERTGTLRYFGPIELDSGDFCGVELDEEAGKHDGTVRGVAYFHCAPGHGILAPVHLVCLASTPHDSKHVDTLVDSPQDVYCAGDNAVEADMPLDTRYTSEMDVLGRVDSGPHSILLGLDPMETTTTEDQSKDPSTWAGSTAPTVPVGSTQQQASAASTPTAGSHEPPQPPQFLHLLDKQNSFDLDESLGILTPDQMADGFTVCDGSSGSSPESGAPRAMPVEAVPLEAGAGATSSSSAPCTVPDVVPMLLEEQPLPPVLEDMEYLVAAVRPGTVKQDGGVSTSDCISEDLASKMSQSGGEALRLDRTPSLEELPMDNHTPSRCARGGKTPNSIITSVTSIASLDTGYQGDGEWSRPGSRGADQLQSPSAHLPAPGGGIKLKGTAIDPMTDSDFFTESDADMQEERLGIAGQGGDRKAQVIDGTLYGGGSGAGAGGGPHRHQQQHEEMDSSGVYSDLERGTPSSNSSQLKEGRTLASLNQELVDALRSMLSPAHSTDANEGDSPDMEVEANQQQLEQRPGVEDTGSMTSLVTVKSQQGVTPIATAAAARTSPKVKEIKKYKMPNRNVVSKVKAMMTPVVIATKTPDDQENTAPIKRTPKKWEAVMQKIASNQEEQSSKLARIKDVKGKVLSSMGVSLTPHSSRSSRSNSISSATPRGAEQRKLKRRLHRLEGASPAGTGTPIISPVLSTASTPRSSNSDVSSLHNRSTRSNKNNNNKSRDRDRDRDRDAVRSASPLSDNGSTNSPAGRTKSATLPITPRATAHGGARERTLRDKAAEANAAEVLKKNHRNKTAAAPSPPRNDKAWSGGAGRTVEKAVVKTPSPRKTAAQRRPTPLKDHNGRLQPEPPAKSQHNGGSPGSPGSPLATALAARKTLPSGLRSPGVTPPTPRTAPSPATSPCSPQQVALEVHKRLLPDLRHNAAAFEAMAVLLKHVTSSMDIFAVPRLKKDLENARKHIVDTVAELERSRAGCKQLEELRSSERVEREELEAARQREDEQHRGVVEELRQKLAQAEALSQRLSEEERALRLRLDSHADSVTRALREEYEAELDRVTRRHEDTLEAALGATREAAEREAAARASEAARREAEVLGQLRVKEAEHAALREQSRKVMDSMKSDKDSRTQALAARCRELQDEVDSLRSVLELRCAELLKSRRENDSLRIAADALPGAEQKISTLTARLEDLQVQLDRKACLENKLNQDNAELQQSFQKEVKEKHMLSLQNEQLQFKLKQNSEIVTVLTNMSGFADISAILNSSAMSKTFPSNGWGRHQDQERNSKGGAKAGRQTPPESPKVKGVVEKSESVSWVLEMETETPEDMMTRLCRRAGGGASAGASSTPVASPAHSPGHRAVLALKRPSSGPPPLAQSASVSTMPSARSTPNRPSLASARTRSRSISSDSAGECNWSPPHSLLTPEYPGDNGHHRRPDRPSAPTPGCDFSDIEDFSSSKSSSMSCSSEGSELGVKESDPERDLEVHYAQTQDVMTASCGSNSELLLAKQATLPKDAGGEAMISEEMTEDDANGIHSASSCDGSCSEEDEESGSSEGGCLARPAPHKPFLTLPIAACAQSAVQSANNTPMDSSWSEDIELPVSLSES